MIFAFHPFGWDFYFLDCRVGLRPPRNDMGIKFPVSQLPPYSPIVTPAAAGVGLRTMIVFILCINPFVVRV